MQLKQIFRRVADLFGARTRNEGADATQKHEKTRFSDTYLKVQGYFYGITKKCLESGGEPVVYAKLKSPPHSVTKYVPLTKIVNAPEGQYSQEVVKSAQIAQNRVDLTALKAEYGAEETLGLYRKGVISIRSEVLVLKQCI